MTFGLRHNLVTWKYFNSFKSCFEDLLGGIKEVFSRYLIVLHYLAKTFLNTLTNELYIFSIWLLGTGTAPCPVWKKNTFLLILLKLISSHTCTSHCHTNYLRGSLCRSSEFFLCNALFSNSSWFSWTLSSVFKTWTVGLDFTCQHQGLETFLRQLAGAIVGHTCVFLTSQGSLFFTSRGPVFWEL